MEIKGATPSQLLQCYFLNLRLHHFLKLFVEDTFSAAQRDDCKSSPLKLCAGFAFARCGTWSALVCQRLFRAPSSTLGRGKRWVLVSISYPETIDRLWQTGIWCAAPGPIMGVGNDYVLAMQSPSVDKQFGMATYDLLVIILTMVDTL